MAVCVLIAAGMVRAADDPVDKLIAQITSGAKTNSARAAKLLAAGKIMTDQPKVCVVVLEKAVEFGMKSPASPAGCKAAVDALDLLEAEFPDRKDEWAQKRVDACRVRYRTAKTQSEEYAAGREYLTALLAVAKIHEKSGDWTSAATHYRQAGPVDTYTMSGMADDIHGKLKTAEHFAATKKRAAQYAALLKKDPSKASTRALLVKLLVVELNDPARAVEYLNEDMGEMWRTCVPLAAKGIGDLTEAACLELGSWYHKELTKNASPTGKGVLLGRARDYYKKFARLHTTVDVQTFRAKAALTDVEKALAKLNAPPVIRVSGRGGRTLVLSMGRGVTMKFVHIPVGEFLMGKRKATKARHKDEAPQHRVTIGKAFYMGVTEVTQSQYQFVTGKNPSKFKAPLNPLEQVSWGEAAAFCKAMSKRTHRTVRLPTEAQWEYACRAGTTTNFSFGADDDALAAHGWCKANGGQKTHQVALKKPNPAGLYDMHGNVWEWCRDWYDSKFYAKAKSVDPENTTQAKARVIRSGSWSNPSDGARTSSRDKESSGNRKSSIGFRVVVEFGSKKEK